MKAYKNRAQFVAAHQLPDAGPGGAGAGQGQQSKPYNGGLRNITHTKHEALFLMSRFADRAGPMRASRTFVDANGFSCYIQKNCFLSFRS